MLGELVGIATRMGLRIDLMNYFEYLKGRNAYSHF